MFNISMQIKQKKKKVYIAEIDKAVIEITHG